MNRNYRNKYIGDRVRIDGNLYEECLFQDCILEYGGTGEVGFVGCSFINPQWTFVGCAENTLNFMEAIRS